MSDCSGHRHGALDRRIGLTVAVQVALDVHDARLGNGALVQIVRLQLGPHAEVGAHGLLGVGRHHDETAPGARPARLRRYGEGDARGADVVSEHPPQFVVGHLPDKRDGGSERSQRGRRVGGRTAGHLGGRAEAGVYLLGLQVVDEGHGALGETELVHQVVGRRSQDVDDGVADSDDFVRWVHALEASGAELG